ncbi:unnamed protein product [Cylicostephanus goldi]|uniref:Uncharacterized protein n=1 Tax=Cylicostephanus goldi TaxID=71465 RepID=A0A3P6UYQ7_CYLGO|nr:unnamed protein product [Cylicostephanus goldi]
MNDTRTPVYLSHTPAGTSSLNIMHWLQMVKKGTVSMYDYGTKENKKKYGQVCCCEIFSAKKCSSLHNKINTIVPYFSSYI